MDPIDYEEFVSQQSERDSLSRALNFPEDDIEVSLVQRKIRTEQHVVPEEPYSQVLRCTILCCVHCTCVVPCSWTRQCRTVSTATPPTGLWSTGSTSSTAPVCARYSVQCTVLGGVYCGGAGPDGGAAGGGRPHQPAAVGVRPDQPGHPASLRPGGQHCQWAGLIMHWYCDQPDQLGALVS